MTALLEVDELHVSYGAIEAVKGITFAVEAGSIVTLIGGNGADSLNGGADDDIVIGGYTSYDLNVSALSAIRSEWSSSASLKDRLNDLQNGGGLNGDVILSNGPNPTVFADKGGNLLNGGYDSDWFFKGATDTTKQDAGEAIEKV